MKLRPSEKTEGPFFLPFRVGKGEGVKLRGKVRIDRKVRYLIRNYVYLTARNRK